MQAALPLADLFTPADWLTLLDISLTGIYLLRPVYEPDGAAIVDFALEYLSLAGQRLMGLAEQPGGTLRGHLPPALAEELLLHYQRVFATGELQGQGFDEMIRQVLNTGVPHVGTEAPADTLREGELVRRYYNFVCQPLTTRGRRCWGCSTWARK